MSKYICLNGEFIKSEVPVLSARNRAFLYGDGLFETMHANGTEIQFLHLHYDRLTKGMKILSMEIPAFWNEEYFLKYFKGLLNRNRHFQGARIRLTVCRNDGGLYTPEKNSVSFVIESAPLENDKYVINKQGFSVDIYPDIFKPLNILAGLKSVSSLLNVSAGIYKSKNKLDDCILLNEKEKVCESISSNIFLLKKEKLYTPALSQGCLPGVMRQVVIDVLKSNGYKFDDNAIVTIHDLMEADELFLTNAISGIRWVLSFRQKRYYNKFSKMFVEMLNDEAFRVD